MCIDPTLFRTIDIFEGVKDGGVLVQATSKNIEDLLISKKIGRVGLCDAFHIALEIIGRPIPNAIMIGAFCTITGLVSLDAVQEAIMEKFPGRVGENNVAALERAREIMH